MFTKLEGHTLHSYDGDLNSIHQMIARMAELVLDQAQQAVYGFTEQNFDTANKVIEREHEVDFSEKKIDDEIIALAARRSPLAKDLRIVMSLYKLVTDLERIGDEAAKISHLTREIFDNDQPGPSVYILRNVTTMAAIVLKVLDEAVATLKAIDLEKAEQLIENNMELDIEFQSSMRRLSTFIMEDSRNVGHIISVDLILKALERIGEHANNIAEYVVFLVKGVDIRHRSLPAE